MMSLTSLLAVAACLLVVLAGALYVFQGKLIYPAPGPDSAPDVPAHVTRISYGDAFGLLLPPLVKRAKPGPALIFAHGNGEAAAHWLGGFEDLRAAGIAVLLVEYPGYAGATGTPNQQSIRAMMLAAYDALTHRDDIDSDRVLAYGRSLGGGAVSELARSRPLAALAFESSFTTLAELVREKGFPAFLLRDRYDNAAVATRANVPVFVFHGTRDTVIPFEHARQLASAGAHVQLFSAPCGHNDCARPWSQLLEFLDGVPGFMDTGSRTRGG